MEAGVVVGAYRVVARLGEGGMGTVWLAQHTMLGRRAAIKVLHPKFTSQPEIVQRFFNEARAAAALSDPGIVQIYDFGHGSDGSAYIAMEMLDGEPLDRRLARLGRMAVGDALRIVRQVASSLGGAHARGIIHRDLKPENIFVVRDAEVPGGERAKILDFGIAKLTGDSTLKTATSTVMGTPSFMSPEQCRGAGKVDQRADVYSLGCVLFALLTGRLPFEAEGAGEIIAMHLREPPRAPSSVHSDLPREIDALVLRCLAKDPEQRFPSGTELAMEIGRLLAAPSGGVEGRDVNTLQAPRAVPMHTPLPLRSRETTLTRKAVANTMMTRPGSNRWAWLGVAAFLVAAGISTTLVLKGRQESVDAATLPSVASAAAVATPSAVEPATKEAIEDATPSPAPVAAAAEPKADDAAEEKAKLRASVEAMIADGLGRFEGWSRHHAGAPCPSLEELAMNKLDPWGHPFSLTCTQQPADQMIGLMSAGEDGVSDSQDDVRSWQLGSAVTEGVRGPRWGSAVAEKKTATTPTKGRKAKREAPDISLRSRADRRGDLRRRRRCQRGRRRWR